jgi:SAM-dependent methyltransferase
MADVSGTEGYAEQAERLIAPYESLAFADVHAPVLHLMPRTAAHILDIGAGTGRDAATLAEMGHSVVAVEPTDELRSFAMALHRSPRIEWLNDSLPELRRLRARSETFDLVMMTAVWMHLDASQRRHGMPIVASLVQEGGLVILSLRHGPVPLGRRMFEVTAEETIELGRAGGLYPELSQRRQSIQPQNRLAGVTWTNLVLRKRCERA